MTRWDSLTTLTLKNNHSRGVKRDKLVKRASEQRSRNQKVQGRLEVGSVPVLEKLAWSATFGMNWGRENLKVWRTA